MSRVRPLLCVLLLCGPLSVGVDASADDASGVQSSHQLMKDCMAKQKASESGKTHAEMRKACKDVTKNEKQNERAADEQAAK